MKEEKVWGTVTHIFCSDDVALSHLETMAGYRCSAHRHEDRVNFFLCLTGKIVVKQWSEHSIEPKLSFALTLRKGESCVVPNGMSHQFEVVESGTVVEVYWPGKGCGPVRLDDIVRYDVGGPV